MYFIKRLNVHPLFLFLPFKHLFLNREYTSYEGAFNKTYSFELKPVEMIFPRMRGFEVFIIRLKIESYTFVQFEVTVRAVAWYGCRNSNSTCRIRRPSFIYGGSLTDNGRKEMQRDWCHRFQRSVWTLHFWKSQSDVCCRQTSYQRNDVGQSKYSSDKLVEERPRSVTPLATFSRTFPKAIARRTLYSECLWKNGVMFWRKTLRLTPNLPQFMFRPFVEWQLMKTVTSRRRWSTAWVKERDFQPLRSRSLASQFVRAYNLNRLTVHDI